MYERHAQACVDSVLVERALRDGDNQVFGILVRRHQGLVRAQLRRLLGDDPATADDLAQETFVLAWRKLEQFRGDARFSTWLYRIAHACFLQHLRRKGSAAPIEPEPDEDGSRAAGPELSLDLDAAMRRLPMIQRTALMYCLQLGLSHEETAQVLELPLGTVKTHVTRGKMKLRQLLQGWASHNEGNDVK